MAKARRQRKPDHLKLFLAALAAGDAASIRETLSVLHPADIAGVLEGLPPEHRPAIWAEVDTKIAGEVLLELPDAIRAELLALLDDQTLVAAVRVMDVDDIADLLPSLSDEVIAEILFALDKQDRQRLDTVLAYPQDTAGGLMNVDAVTVREGITLEVALRYLRRRAELPENTDKLFVVDRNDRLVGALPLPRLLTADPATRVGEVMERDLIKFTVLTPDREVAAAFERYNLVSAPVVDEHNHLLGRITVDDAVDVLREEADQSLMEMAGLRAEEDIFAPVTRSLKNRWVWLSVNLVTAFIASRVIGLFEGSIEKLVALASLMPIVAGVGGNTGNQTITMIVRAIALGKIHTSNVSMLYAKEIGVAVINGLMFGAVMGVVAYLLYRNPALGLVMMAAMLLNLLLAAVMGVTIPLLRQRFGTDPAIGTSVLITAITDSGGFFIFLGLATVFLI